MHSDPLENKSRNVRCSRRSFLGYSGGVLAAGALTSAMAGDASGPNAAPALADNPTSGGPSPLIWGYLLHLSFNMWSDRVSDWGKAPTAKELCCQPYLRCDDGLWTELTQRMADAGMNMVAIDLGDAVQYQSHPEIAVKGAWSIEKLRAELARLRTLGLEPIPKLNFSTGHDIWLGPYARQVSTPVYYKVCEDLIDEVIRLFDKPRFFHLGYDEETAKNQVGYDYVVLRQHELWWRDFEFFVKAVEGRSIRPWIWSDYAWEHGEEFFKRMPKSVLQSNWFYWPIQDTNKMVQLYGELDLHGYDQIPTGSNWSSPKNFGSLVEYCRKKIVPAHLKGFLQTSWAPTLGEFRQRHIEAIDQVAAAIAAYSKQTK